MCLLCGVTRVLAVLQRSVGPAGLMFLVRFLKRTRQAIWRGKETKWYLILRIPLSWTTLSILI